MARRVGASSIDDAAVASALGIVLITNLRARRRSRTVPLRIPEPIRLWVPFCVTLPAAVVLAVLEHTGGTPGKRVLGLRTGTSSGGSPTWPQVLLRSLLKTGLPWELGHQAVWELRRGQNAPGGVLAGSAYALVLAQLIASAAGTGRTYADRLTGTTVFAVPPRRRRSDPPTWSTRSSRS